MHIFFINPTNCLWRILTDIKVLSQACEDNTLQRSRFEGNAQNKQYNDYYMSVNLF